MASVYSYSNHERVLDGLAVDQADYNSDVTNTAQPNRGLSINME
jgi:hypothetical protein